MNNFLISAESILCGYLLEPSRPGGSNEYPQGMFKAEINIEYPCETQFHHIQVGYEGV